MAQYRRTNPYDPRYALPGNVLAEPPGRGAIVTAQLPRGTYFPAPRKMTGGYALPDYVEAEHGGGVVYTTQMPRRTIATGIPEALGAFTVPADAGDPIKAYGERASEFLLRTLRREVPAEFRGVALEALLDEVEPGLFSRVTERANRYKERGLGAESAVQAAMASSMSEGIAREILKLGRGGVPAARSQAGLGFYGDASAQQALDGIWSSIKRGVKKAGRGIAWPAQQAYKGVKKGASYVKRGAQKAYSWGKKAVDKLGSLACGVLNSPVIPMAAGAAASAYGVPAQVGAKGAQVGSSFCAKSDTPAVSQEALMRPSSPAWVMPAALGGAGLLAVLIMTRKR